MQKLLHDDLWKRLGTRARASKRRRAAIAYVTEDHLGLREGDQLIVDASDLAVRSGETNAKLLLQLHRRGVEIYSRRGLHAKIILLDDVVFVGSANMSKSSAERLDEAGILTDHPGTIAATQVLLARWTSEGTALTERRLETLAQLPVSPRRGPANIGGARATSRERSGDRVWVVGVSELRDDAFPEEDERAQRGVERAERKRRYGQGELEWIRWTGDVGFGVECRRGDIVFQVQKSLSRKRLYVQRPMTVVLTDREPTCRRIHLEPYPGRMVDEMTLLQFQDLLRSLGVKRPVGERSSRCLSNELGEGVVKAWKRWRR